MLEFAGSFSSFWGVGGDAVGVGFEGCSGGGLATEVGGAEGY